MNYVRLAAMAKRLIEANGRDCTFSRLGRDPADVTKPWRGMSSATGATHPPVSYANIKAVIFGDEFVVGQHVQPIFPEQFAQGKGGIVRTGYEYLIVADTSFPGGHVDITTIDTVNDGNRTYRVAKAAELMPGITPLIYQLTLES